MASSRRAEEGTVGSATGRSGRGGMLPHIGFIAVIFGVVSVVAALCVGYISYFQSVKATEERYEEFYLKNANMLVLASVMGEADSNEEVIRKIETMWTLVVGKAADGYVCVSDEKRRIILHTCHPEMVGRTATGVMLSADGTPDGSSADGRVLQKAPYSGRYLTGSNQEEVVAFVPMPGRKWVLGVHRSRQAIQREIFSNTKSLIIGFLVTCGLLIPLSLLTMYSAFRNAFHKHRTVKKALKVSEEKFSKVFHSSPIAVSITTVEEGRFLEVNEAFTLMSGFERDELIGRTSVGLNFWLNPEEDRNRFVRSFRERGASKYLEAKIRFKDGKVHTTLWSMDSIVLDGTECFINCMTDISERKKSEEELRETTQTLEAIIQASPLGIVAADVEGRVTMWNAAAEKIYGWTREEVLGRGNPAIPEKGERPFKEIIDHMVRLGTYSLGPHTSDAVKRRRKDGAMIEVSVAGAALRDHEGNVTGAIGMVTDITERKKLEAQLRQAHKLEAIGTLAGGIAHDFNNILAAIMGYTELTLPALAPESRERKNLENVMNASLQAKSLIKQILSFSRQAEQEYKPVHLDTIIKDGLKLLRASIPATVEIRSRLENGSGAVMADPTQIHQVLMNLCANAAHAMGEEGGVLGVDLVRVELDGTTPDTPPGITGGSFYRLAVSDTGHGMDQRTMDRIFEPFFTTKPKGQGTGLGLSVVHGIVKSHRGVITVKSELKRGTVFSVYVPVLKEGGAKAAMKEEGPVIRGTGNVLLVEDEAEMVEIERQMLEALGYTVTSRVSSLEALALFTAKPHAFDLVISDHTMPHLTGLEMVMKMMRVRPDIPVLLCTGFSEHLTEEKVTSMGIKGLLMKPLLLRELGEAVRAALS